MSALTLSPQMMSFPKFIRKSEQSTRGLDGAFPPFKIEHRYKSVYERAGFDVNRGGNNNNSDSKSMTSRKTSRNHSQSNFCNPNESNTRLQDQSPSSSSYQNTPVLQKNRIPSLASGGANTRNNSPTASSHSSKSSSVNSNFTNSKSASSHSTFRNTDEFSPVFDQPLTSGSSTTTFFNNDNEAKVNSQNYNPPIISKNTTNMANDEPIQDQFDFSPTSNHSRNQKNLKLDLSNNDNISDTQSLPGITKVVSQQNTITNHSMHSVASNSSAQTHKQAEQPQVPSITINEEDDEQQQQQQQHENQKNASAEQGFQVLPPPVQNNGAPAPKFDPRKQRSIRGQTTNPPQQHHLQQQQQQQQQGQGQPPRNPYSSVGQQSRNGSTSSLTHSAPHPHHHNNSRPSSPSLSAVGSNVPQLPMMSLNSPTTAYRPSQRPQSPVLPTGYQSRQQPQSQPQILQSQPSYPSQPPQPPQSQSQPQQAVYNPFNHHQHRKQAPGGYYNQPQEQIVTPRSARQQATYSQIRDDKLSSALNDFKNDVEIHKQGGNKSPTHSNSSLEDELPSSASPSELGLYKNDSKEDYSNENTRFSYGTTMNSGMNENGKGFDPSAQFQNFTSQQVAKDANLNNEYAEFLATQNDEPVSGVQDNNVKNNKHLSTVSSILSKDSGNSDDDDIERELERQLQSLKMSGSSIDITKVTSNKSRNSFGYGNNGGIIPLFNVQDVDEVAEEDEEEYVKPLSISGSSSYVENKQSIVEDLNDDDFTRPLTTHSSTESKEDLQHEVSQPQLDSPSLHKKVQFESPQAEFFNEEDVTEETIKIENNDDEYEEAVKPLSPKTHSIEQELQNMNFQIPETDESPSVYIQDSFPQSTTETQPQQQEEDFIQDRSFTFPPESVYPVQDPILEVEQQQQLEQPQNQTPYPTKELSPELDLEENEQSKHVEPTIYASGTGPCRACHGTIDRHTKVKPLKPIFSKTGELSGQWHRQCFTCTSPQCSIQFSKNVQCYVFNDHPYCFEHYHILNNSVCKSCHVGIEGKCISNELDEKWHLQCLNCTKCGNGIRSDYFIINGNSIMCSSCKENNSGLTVADRIEKRRTRIYNV